MVRLRSTTLSSSPQAFSLRPCVSARVVLYEEDIVARKTVGYVHMEWVCPNCGSRNPGTKTICSNCAAPQPENVQFEQVAQEELITDEKLIARAKTGSDVHCPFCGTRNPAGAVQCSACFGDLSEASARQTGQTVGAHTTKPVPDVPCPHCGTMNSGTATHCINCQAILAKTKPDQSAQPIPPTRLQRKVSPLLYLVLVLAVAACGVFFYLSTRTEESIGHVADVLWERTINVEALVPVERDAWKDEIPAGGSMGACREEVRYTSAFPEPNSQEVCGTPYTVDTGTGVGEVVQDCEYQVYDDYCSYMIDEWQVVDQVSSSGRNFAPEWPALNLGLEEREGAYEEVYTVTIDGDGRSYTYHPDNFNEYQQFDIGSSWILEVNAFNAIRSLRPAN